MIHLIRHAPKAWDNGKKPKFTDLKGESHDPPLDYDQLQADLKCMRLADRILNQEDAPTMILSSPFLRCRQTAELMNSRMVFHNEELLTVIPSPLLREYLGNWRDDQVQITDDTRQLLYQDTVLSERWGEFECRMQEASQFIKHTFDTIVNENDSIWIVSHRIVIRELNRLLTQDDYPVACHFLE